ncbi:NmrA-domain-containing protein [Sanghuangporus baumii]|uniref:NmrA-domain-containing protein n=1 Tax=Sanghuangporus baumii TaxID=108892 RepID=A0A9Q5I563_SANBA|nr:NmrA-domain-containing protein [Sanghuangporus baumii]
MVLVEKRLIAVTGATGLQGGSVIRYLLEDGTFRVRALTRKPSSARAKELQGKGVEVVFADFEDPSSLNSALQGAYGVFDRNFFYMFPSVAVWESMDGEKETRHGKALVDAAKANNIQHFLWSTVSAPPRDLDIKHWASKARVDDYLVSSGLPRTSLYSTFYFENFILFDFAKLTRASETQPGKYIANWPLLLSDGPLGGFSVTETGAYVLEAFKDPKKWIDKNLYIPPDVFTPREFVNALNEILGGKAVIELKEVDEETFAGSRTLWPGAEELWTNMTGFYRAGGKMRNMDSTSSKTGADSAYSEQVEQAILPNRLTMQKWVQEHVDEILAAAL